MFGLALYLYILCTWFIYRKSQKKADKNIVDSLFYFFLHLLVWMGMNASLWGVLYSHPLLWGYGIVQLFFLGSIVPEVFQLIWIVSRIQSHIEDGFIRFCIEEGH